MGDRKIIEHLNSKLMLRIDFIVQMMGVCDGLIVVKEVSLHSQVVNSFNWEKLAHHTAGRERLLSMAATLTNLETAGIISLKVEMFPHLAKHAAALSGGAWHGHQLKMIPAAGGSPSCAFFLACKQVANYYMKLASKWFHRIIGPHVKPKIWAVMEGCLDLRALARSPCSLSAETQAKCLGQLLDWVQEHDVIWSLLPDRAEMLAQQVRLCSRLQVMAGLRVFKEQWKEVLEGKGSGTVIMSVLFTQPQYYEGIEDWLYLFNHMILKAGCESVVESMGCIIDQHAAGGRHLDPTKYSMEAVIHWNGPKLHHAKSLLHEALDLHFGQKGWHFEGKTEGDRLVSRNSNWKVSKVVDRLMAEESRLSFMNGDVAE